MIIKTPLETTHIKGGMVWDNFCLSSFVWHWVMWLISTLVPSAAMAVPCAGKIAMNVQENAGSWKKRKTKNDTHANACVFFMKKSRELPFMLNHNISWKFIFFIYCIGIFHSIPIKKSCDMLPFRQKFTGHIKPYKVSNDLFQTFSALQHKKRSLDFSRFLQCGWWDSNPHDITTARFWVWCVCQFRHSRESKLLDNNIIEKIKKQVFFYNFFLFLYRYPYSLQKWAYSVIFK